MSEDLKYAGRWFGWTAATVVLFILWRVTDIDLLAAMAFVSSFFAGEGMGRGMEL